MAAFYDVCDWPERPDCGAEAVALVRDDVRRVVVVCVPEEYPRMVLRKLAELKIGGDGAEAWRMVLQSVFCWRHGV